LIPTKSKEIVKKLIKEHDLNESYTEDVISFVWSEIKKSLTEMTHSQLYVNDFGTFSVRKARLNKALTNYKIYLDSEAPKSFEEYSHRMTIEKNYKKYLVIKEQLDKEHYRKVEKFRIKKQYENSKNINNREGDSGGSQEQHS
jgi:nucleoid DNA-binding protein